MNDGMKIILERMKTHPEEFKDDNKPFAYDGKWIGLVSDYENNLPEEDMKAFKKAIDEMRQEEFTAKVMEELLDPKSEQMELDLNPKTGMFSAGQTLASSLTNSKPWVTAGVLTSNNPTSTPTTTVSLDSVRLHELLHMKAEIDLEKQKQKQKSHKTIFGKLFNYS
jgi:hypothetical protein